MSQWGQQQGYQYPMQTGFQQNPQFQQQNPQLQQQNPQFQQQQFQQQPQQQQQLGFGNGGLAPQQTGFPQQRQFQQPQQTGFPMQPQQTGFAGNFQQQNRAPPPVPPIPSQFQQQQQPNQGGPSFLNMPPPQQRFLSPSPAMGVSGLSAQPTGFAGARPLIPQMTGFVDPRLQMMSNTFLPMNTSAPYNPSGVPQLQPQQNLQQSFQAHNQEQRGSSGQQMSWALSKAEKKNYNNIFRSWDANGTGFISGQTALEVFGASGLPKDDLARIWTLADINDRGKLDVAEFHVAMGLIYRRLNGMPIPDVLPPELVPPSARDLDSSIDLVKNILQHETRSRSPGIDSPVSRLKNRSFNSSSSSLESGRDATIYKHRDAEPEGGYYKSRNRHVDRDAVRARNDDSPTSDLSDMKRQLANTAQMLDRAAEADASRTKEDEELDREMDDLKYRVKRVQDDLDYLTRGPRTSAKDEERRRLERELLELMHERVPEVERKIKAREERKEREKRQWTRDRDRANERFGRFDGKRDDYERDRDRDSPYSRGGDRPYSRGGAGYEDRDRDRMDSPRDGDKDRDWDSRDRDRGDRDRRDIYDRERERPTIREAPAPPSAAPASAIRDPPPAPTPPRPTPSPAPLKNMTREERAAYAREEAQRRIQARMAALGVTAPSSSPAIVDTSVEDRLKQEKKEAEEKAKAAEKQAEERERARNERLAKEGGGRGTPAPPVPTPTKTTTAAPPVPTPTTKVAPPPPAKRTPAPPPPRKQLAPRTVAVAPPPAPASPATRQPPAPAVPEVDPEEERLRAREEAIRKQREERAARLRELEREEEEAARAEEERMQARMQALKARNAAPPTPEAPPAPKAPPAPTPPAVPAAAVGSPPANQPSPAVASPAEKSTNPFTRMLSGSGTSSAAASPAVTPATTTNAANTNPWARSAAPSAPPPSRSPALSPPPASKSPYYQKAPSSATLDDDWDVIKENDEDTDSSDDEMLSSRATRAKIAQDLFGGGRPASAAANPKPSSPAPPPPPPPPVAPIAPAPTSISTPAPAAAPGDVGALMRSIQGGLKLKPTKTVDKSGPGVSGRVLGDTAPPAHINAAPRPPSPVTVSTPTSVLSPPQDDATEPKNTNANRQSVDWFATRAADAGAAPLVTERLPSTAEDDEEIYQTPTYDVPEIKVEEHESEHPADVTTDLMADIDKTTEHRARSLYAFEGEGPDDLSFGESLVLTVNPSKTGGDWWYGTTVSEGKSGLFPKTYVEIVHPKKAKALYTYTGTDPDQLPFNEGDEIDIIDMSDAEWWKAEQGGVVFIVPAAYLEVVEEQLRANYTDETSFNSHLIFTSDNSKPIIVKKGEDESQFHDEGSVDKADATNSYEDSDDSDSDYLSFGESDNENDYPESKEDRAAREHERQLVLEAAGLVVNQDPSPRPNMSRTKSKSTKRRPPPAAPKHRSRRKSSEYFVSKDLPPVPNTQIEPETSTEPEPASHEQQLDDAFARYESFRDTHANLNRLSVVSTDSSLAVPSSPTSASTLSTSSQNHAREGDGRYSNFLHFLGKNNRTPEGERKSNISTVNISAPIMNSNSGSGISVESPSRSNSPAFGTSWASLVDKTALEGIPPNERRRQEAIFELIATEVAYVRDLQLIVEVFYSSMLPLLSRKEVTVVFANIEDILLTNTTFVSSLEERQKECRLYMDSIGDILLAHFPNMGVYMEYCVNQSNAIKVLQSLRTSNPELAVHLQRLRDSDPSVRNLDLSSYLLAPMQRITRYPLLLKQVLHYTEKGEEYNAIKAAQEIAEKLLAQINEAIREQEGRETLKRISQHLWIGQGRLDLTAPTRFMGPRRLLKEGPLIKTKSGRKLHAFLCSDILVLTDSSQQNLYRMPIPLAQAQVKEVPSGRDDTIFQISQPYPRGGDSISLKATSIRDCQLWVQEIELAIRRSRHAEDRAARNMGRK